MDEAQVVFSRAGLFKTTITAREIRSREHFRKMWPLVTVDEPRRLVTWVSPGVDGCGNVIQRSHFRRYPNKHKVDLAEYFSREEKTRQRLIGESEEHKRAKRLIAEELQRRLDLKLALPWSYRDTTISQYHLEGNLLLGADKVVQEQSIKTPFGNYRLDVAVVGRPILQQPLLLGGVEIELGHAFDGLKALAGRSIGFPLISIDISGMTMDQLTPEWALWALTATTASREDGHRKTFIYLNDLLYPLYVRLPSFFIEGDDCRHQFIVFADDGHLEKLRQILAKVAHALHLETPRVLLTIVNGKSESAAKQVANLGAIAGLDWGEFNAKKCLTITLDRPRSVLDVPSHLMHIAIATLLARKGAGLVGYKNRLGNLNYRPEEDIWMEYCDGERHRILPKRLAEPFQRYLTVISELINQD